MPGTFFGPFGEQDNNYAFEVHGNLGRFPLGHTLILPDDREYKFTLNDGTVEVAGNLYQSVVALAGHTNRQANVVRAIGATVMSATITTSIAEVDIYAEGMVHVNNDAGEGYAYRIRRAFAVGQANASASSVAVLTVALAPGESVQVEIDTSSDLSFTRNRYHQVIIHDSPATAQLTGVSPGVAAADRFYWSQIKGRAAVHAEGTLLVGLPVMPSIAQDGRVENWKRRARSATTLLQVAPTGSSYTHLLDQDGNTTTFLVPHTVANGVTITADISGPASINGPVIGQCIKANSDTDFALIDLAIP